MEKKKITIDDVARELGMSKTTVSRAISGKGRISAATRERVMEYIEATGYRPSAIARGLANSKTYNIAFVMPGDKSSSDMPFFQKCLWGISNTAAKRDYDVILAMVSGDDIGQLKRLIVNNKIDGVIIGRTYEKDPSQQFLSKAGIPFVTIGTAADTQIMSVDNDHKSGCKQLVGEIFKKKISRPVMIGGEKELMVNKQRYAGFIEAMNDLGCKDFTVCMDKVTVELVEEAVDRCLEEGCDYIFAMDDSICSIAMNRLISKNISVPGDIGVASFYYSSLLDGYRPRIPSISFNVNELGEKSCELLLKKIDKEAGKGRVVLGYEIKI